MIKEVTVFTNGDSSKISTWSNVPFFFTETLMSKGIKVNRVNIDSTPFYQKLYRKTINRIIRRIYKTTSYEYFRSAIHFFDVRRRIKKAINQYPNSDAFIFLTFSFSSAGLTQKPTIQFCDWTYDHHVNYFLKRKPDFFEKQCIKREDAQINGSNLILPLFPGVAEYMKKRYTNNNIHYLGNVINSLFQVSEEDVLKIKRESNKILFIGSRKYLDGAKTLIQAFILLKQKYTDLTLHFIGLTNGDFETLPNDVYCYGYLDKAKDADRDLYYNLLKEAKVFVNTTPQWGAFSASIEAMYFYVPVVVTPYNEFVETFGKSIDEMGAYSKSDSDTLLAEKIEYVMFHKSYEQLCRNAHNAVKEFTWDSYIDKVTGKIEEII